MHLPNVHNLLCSQLGSHELVLKTIQSHLKESFLLTPEKLLAKFASGGADGSDSDGVVSSEEKRSEYQLQALLWFHLGGHKFKKEAEQGGDIAGKIVYADPLPSRVMRRVKILLGRVQSMYMLDTGVVDSERFVLQCASSLFNIA